MENLISAVFGRFTWLMVALLGAVMLPSVALMPLLPPLLLCFAVLLLTCCGRFSFTAIKLRVQKLE